MRAWRLTSSTMSAGSEYGGSEHAESPEWMPASSMCSITPPTTTAPVLSATTSTSSSTASSRNWSTSSGKPTVRSSPLPLPTPSDALEVVLEAARVVDALHRAAAEHVARAHHHREADLVRRPCAPRRGCARCPSAARAGRACSSPRRTARDPRRDRSRRRSCRGSARRPAASGDRELERRLAAELHDHAPRLLDVADLEHVLERERLEVQPVATCRSRSTPSPGCS